MRYYLIAGEASGDLHASHLMAALRSEDPSAQFRCVGGDMMRAQGAAVFMHYGELAYMGFIPVMLHLRTILRGMSGCRRDIVAWHPDVVILVDYPGFNLRMAKFLRDNTRIPVYYYISPKIWAWKEHRIRDIRRNVDELFSILPFEVDFFEKKHHYPVHYVGNPTVDEVDAFKRANKADFNAFVRDNGLDARPVIALLAGSRKQEIEGNLSRMIKAASVYGDSYQLIIAGAPGIEDSFYVKFMGDNGVRLLRGETFRILQHSTAALVTSGTATLETALFRVPQVVCYYMKAGKLASLARRLVLKIPFISLVNLIVGREIVPELVAGSMTVENVQSRLASILPGGTERDAQLRGYDEMAHKLGSPGAPKTAAKIMVGKLRGNSLG